MDIYEAIHHRRSHRMYKPEMPPKAALDRVIDAALWAPSGTNAQAWEITVMAGKVRDEFVEIVSRATKFLLPELQKAGIPEKGQELVMKFFKNLGGAPVAIAVTIAKHPDPGMHVANLQSGAALFQNLLLAAHAEGLGTCWMTGANYLEISGERGPTASGHHPHRLLRQGTIGAAPERARSPLAGVLGAGVRCRVRPAHHLSGS